MASRAYIQVYFNYDLTVRGIGSSDGYDTVAENLYSQGVIDSLPDRHYFEAFQQEFVYWDGRELR